MERKEFDDLIKRYLEGVSTEEERDLLHLWLVKHAGQEEREWSPGEAEDVERRLRLKLKGLVGEIGTEERLSRRFRRVAAVAAVLVVLLSIGVLLFQGPGKPVDQQISRHQQQIASHIPPVLTLHVEGTDYRIDSLPIGIDTYVGGVAVRRTSLNSLSYLAGSNNGIATNDNAAVYHRLSVPKGKDFNVTLPDGSVVWMNTESTLEFPVVFSGADRRVTMSGEAFFEVASDKAHPFRVAAAEGTEVVATGTQFSVKAYRDEMEMYATLVEGVITVTAKGESLTMQPNQQAVSKQSVAGIQVSAVDVKSIIAKKNGYFAFFKQDITSIMKEVSRWYDVDVYFQGEVSPRLFGGTFSRQRPLNDLLEYFESIGSFKFKQKGRRIIVMS